MRLSINQSKMLLAVAATLGLLCSPSRALADPPASPPPVQEPDPTDPPLEHTAQDDVDDPPLVDHTAQDGEEPVNPPFEGKQKVKGDPDDRGGPRESAGHPFDRNPGFDAPLVDLLDLSTSRAPDMNILREGASTIDELIIPTPTMPEGYTTMPLVTNTSIPSPGALIVIGMGALALHRRRRR